MKNERAVLIKFNALQVSYWWSFASMPAFITAFLLSKGMSNTELSLLLAVYMLFAFLGQFFWGAVCDKLRTNKKIFILSNILVLTLNLLIYVFAGNTVLIAVFYPLLGFVMVPIPSNLDAWLLKCFAHRPQVYGPARGWSSIGYAVFMLGYGMLISNLGYWIMPIFVTVLTVSTVIIALTQPDSPPPEGPKAAFKIKDIGKLIHIKPYMYLIVILLFTGLAVAPINNMKIVVLESVGGNVSHQGFDSFFMCLCQFPFFFLAGKLRFLSQKMRLLLAAGGTMIMIVMNLFAFSPYMVIAASCFNAISYSILLPTMREITEANVDPTLRTTAHGVTDAVYQSLAGMIALLYGGAVMDNFGMKILFTVCIVMQAVPLIMTLIKLFGKKKETV